MKRSKNVLGFYSNTKERFKGLFGKAFVATMITVFPFIAVLFAAGWLTQLISGMFSVVAFLALVGYACAQVGHIRYIRELASGQKPSYKVLFSGFAEIKTPMYLFLGIVLFIIYLIAGLLLIVPLFFAIGAFSMVFYFVEHHQYETILDALSTTEKRMRRQKGNMFAYKFMFYIVYAVLIIVFLIGVFALSQIAVPVVSIISIVALHILFFVLFSIVTTYYSFCNYNFFMEVLEYHERMGKKPVSKEIPEREKQEAKEDKITKVSVEEPVIKKVSATKKPTTTAKKTTTTATKKTSSVAKKSATTTKAKTTATKTSTTKTTKK